MYVTIVISNFYHLLNLRHILIEKGHAVKPAKNGQNFLVEIAKTAKTAKNSQKFLAKTAKKILYLFDYS